MKQKRRSPRRNANTTRLWRIAGVLTLIGAEALLYGYSYPFFSLALEKRELANWLIGLNASVASAGILFVGPFLPRLIHRFGLKYVVAAMFAVSFLSFGAILLVDHLAMWFAARFVMGTCFAALWTTTEIWLNGVVDDKSRGRVIGASGTLYAACQFLGPLVLGGVGVTGSVPLIVAMVPLAIGAVVALSIRPVEDGGADEESSGNPHSLKLAITLAAALVAAAFLCGVGETAMQSLLPLYGLAHGFDDAGAARLVAAFSLGEAVLVAGLGWMADRYGRRLTMRLCVIVATITSLLLPLSVGSALLLWPVLFFAGGTVAGIYTLGIVLIGQDFRNQKLTVVSTGYAMSYSAGCIVGSAPVGYLIDLFGPEALPISIAIGFLGLTVYLFMSGTDRQPSAEHSEARAMPNLTYLEDSLFDEDEAPVPSAETPAHAALVRAPSASPYRPPNGVVVPQRPAPPQPVTRTDPRWRHETNLEEVFRQRAAEIAEMIAERQKPGGGRPGTRAAQGPLHAPSPFRPPAGNGKRTKLELT
jgi:MFS family permease